MVILPFISASCLYMEFVHFLNAVLIHKVKVAYFLHLAATSER